MNVKRQAALIMRGKLKLWEKLYPEWFEALTKEYKRMVYKDCLISARAEQLLESRWKDEKQRKRV